jgi:hypothetical protein
MNRFRTILFCLVATLAAAYVAPGCGARTPAEPQPWLPDYYGWINTMHMMSVVPTRPQVQVGDGSMPTRTPRSGMDAIRQGTQVVGTVAGSRVATDLENRLDVVVPPERVRENFAAALAEAVPRSMPVTAVADMREEHDTRLEVEVSAYGINARNLSAPAYYVMRADARLIFVPEGRVIWHAVTHVNERVSADHPMFGGTLGRITGTSINLSALQELEDDDLQRVFDAMVADAAASIAEQLRRDSVR